MSEYDFKPQYPYFSLLVQNADVLAALKQIEGFVPQIIDTYKWLAEAEDQLLDATTDFILSGANNEVARILADSAQGEQLSFLTMFLVMATRTALVSNPVNTRNKEQIELISGQYLGYAAVLAKLIFSLGYTTALNIPPAPDIDIGDLDFGDDT